MEQSVKDGMDFIFPAWEFPISDVFFKDILRSTLVHQQDGKHLMD